jgi:16S rRNA G966 N2-methylase RsmD
VISWSVETASRGANPALVVDDQQIETTTVDEVERQFNAALMASRHVHVADGRHAAFDFEMRRNRFALVFRKVLIDSEVVVDPPDVRASAEDIAVARWLLDYPLHL